MRGIFYPREWGRLAFTAVNTLTVLPFTVQFFSEFVRPPDGPWRAAYLVALPLFLGALEYVGVQLACLFWRERKGEALALFAACQALAVCSTYYDVRAIEWRAMTDVRRSALSQEARRVGDRERSIGSDRSALRARLREVEKDRAAALRQVGSSRSGRAGRPAGTGTGRSRSAASRRAMRRSPLCVRPSGATSGKRRPLRKRVAGTYGQDASGAPLPSASLPGTSAPTALAYAGGTLLSGLSLASLGLALLFPLTVLALARVLVGGEASTEPVHVVDLRRELEEGAALPEERHESYAALLEPVIAAHLASLRAARSAAVRGLGLHLELDADLDFAAAATELRGQIDASGLCGPARDRLRSLLDRILAEGVTPSAA